ncbi:MAG: MlaD family protein [Planctomycetota bacterium]|jgi:paraquat-inducible protein B
MATNSHAKLGLFIVLSALLLIGSGVFFAMRYRDQPTHKVITYFREPVSGLGEASPVRFRGVDVGRVEGVTIDASSLLVRVDFELFVDVIEGFGGSLERIREEALDLGLRVRTSTSGLTGQSFLMLDLDPDAPPALDIDNLPDDRAYLPSVPSPITNAMNAIEDSLARLPQVLDRLDQTLVLVNQGIINLSTDTLGRETAALLADLRSLTASTEGAVTTLSDDGSSLLNRAEQELLTLHLGQLSSQLTALLATANEEIGSLGVHGASAADELSLTLTDLRGLTPTIDRLSRELSALLRAIQDQPEAILFGPRPVEEVAP